MPNNDYLDCESINNNDDDYCYNDNYYSDDHHNDESFSSLNKNKIDVFFNRTQNKKYNNKILVGQDATARDLYLYPSGGRGTFIKNATNGIKTNYKVGSSNENLFFSVIDSSAYFIKIDPKVPQQEKSKKRKSKQLVSGKSWRLIVNEANGEPLWYNETTNEKIPVAYSKEPLIFYFDNPEQYENIMGVILPTSTKKKWHEKFLKTKIKL